MFLRGEVMIYIKTSPFHLYQCLFIILFMFHLAKRNAISILEVCLQEQYKDWAFWQHPPYLCSSRKRKKKSAAMRNNFQNNFHHYKMWIVKLCSGGKRSDKHQSVFIFVTRWLLQSLLHQYKIPNRHIQ